MAAVLVCTANMLGDVSCNGVQVLEEDCLQKKLKRQSEKYHTFFMLGNGLR